MPKQGQEDRMPTVDEALDWLEQRYRAQYPEDECPLDLEFYIPGNRCQCCGAYLG